MIHDFDLVLSAHFNIKTYYKMMCLHCGIQDPGDYHFKNGNCIYRFLSPLSEYELFWFDI